MEKKDRVFYFDILRIIACFSVVMLHSSAMFWYDIPVDSTTWLVSNSWNALVRFGVPIFVMISGAIFLDGDRELDVRRLYTHNILRFAVMYVLWSLAYGIIDYSKYDVTQVSWKVFVNEWVGGRYHLWFLPMLMGIYILLPILRSWVQGADVKNLQYFLALFLLFQIGRETARVWVLRIPVVISLINTAQIEMVCGYLGYFVLGYYIAHYGIAPKLHKYIYGAGLIGCVGNVLLGNLIALRTGEARGDVYDCFTFFTFCVVLALFLVCREKLGAWKPGARVGKVICGISADTLGIYLLHVGVIELVAPMKYGVFAKLPVLISIPVLAICTFVICMLITAVLRRIPGLGRYLS